ACRGEGSLEDACDDIAGVELRGQLAREPSVATIVRFHGRQRPDRLVHVAEAEEALGIRENAALSAVLDDGGLSAGEVAEGSVADPGVREGHAARLHAAELASRLLDVCAILLGGRAHIPGLADPPSKRFHA